MKKLTLSIFALVAISFISCKKDYTCVCNWKGTTVEASRSTINDTKDKAKSTCSDQSSGVKDCSIQ